eukprot:11218434-Lingulodinium_polyedra.AAC.1
MSGNAPLENKRRTENYENNNDTPTPRPAPTTRWATARGRLRRHHWQRQQQLEHVDERLLCHERPCCAINPD